jgi:hypothetical protein
MISTFRASGLTPLRAAILAYCVVLYALIAMGAFSTQRIGAMTWGPTTDFWAAAIAISDIELGMGGGLGRRELSFAQAQVLSTSGDDKAVHDDETRQRVLDPALVTQAFQDAAAIDPASLEPLPFDSEMFVTTVFEDIGYADFYNVAFRLFGYDAFSTYKLYMSLLGLTVVFFMVGQWRSPFGLSVLALGLSGLLLLTTSLVFAGPGIPSIAANRALGTLAMLPALYIIVASFEEPPARWLARLATGLQILLFAFFVFLRTSAIWAVVGLAALLVVVVCIRALAVGKNHRNDSFLLAFLEPIWVRRAVYVLGASLIAVTGYSAIRTSQLHFLYDTDDILPHHLRWHSAYIALVHNPAYVKHPDFFGADGETGDNVAWSAYRNYMASKFPGSPARSKVSGGHKSRLHEHILKEKFVEFAKANPRYMFDLYFYYKPLRYLAAIKQVIASVPAIAWLIAAPTWGMFVLSLLSVGAARPGIRVIPAVALLFAASFAPFVWAYSSPHTMFDHFVIMIVLFFMLTGWGASALISRWRQRRAQRDVQDRGISVWQ